jgi:tRNA(Ile)-lysidine synthase
VIDAVAKFIHQHALLKPGDRLGVAVSGGADSVALLRVMLELRGALGIVLAVAHFNHKIRGAESDGDEQFVRELAEKFGLQFFCGSADVPAFAREQGLGLEAAARKLRYEYFATLLVLERGTKAPGLKPMIPGMLPPGLKAEVPTGAGSGSGFTLDKIATAHTQNDQAETVLMRLLRGAGTRGLSGIRTSIFPAGEPMGVGEVRGPGDAGDVASYVSAINSAMINSTINSRTGTDTDGENLQTAPVDSVPCVVRPLLAVTRHEIAAYLESIHQPWREDSSNCNLEHTRNRVRRELIPLLERDFNPAIIRVLAEHAEMAQAEEEFWNSQVEEALKTIYTAEGGILKVAPLLQLPAAFERRAIRAAAERQELTLDFEHIEAVRHLIHSPAGLKPRRITLPGGVAEYAERGGARELVLRKGSLINEAAKDYEYRLPVPGAVAVPEIGRSIRARLVTVQEVGKTAFQSYNQPQLLNPQCLGGGLIVRNWRQGDRFWPAHTKSPKKVKELLQKKTEAERKVWPVITSGDEIVWMRGFPPSARASLPADAPASASGLFIEEFGD